MASRLVFLGGDNLDVADDLEDALRALREGDFADLEKISGGRVHVKVEAVAYVEEAPSAESHIV